MLYAVKGPRGLIVAICTSRDLAKELAAGEASIEEWTFQQFSDWNDAGRPGADPEMEIEYAAMRRGA